MSMPQAKQSPRQPEMKFGPFSGGMSVAIWRNTIETEKGPREVRSVTINPRRYKDATTGEWKDSSFRQSDLPVLILALQSAWQHMTLHPLPQAAEGETGEQEPF